MRSVAICLALISILAAVSEARAADLANGDIAIASCAQFNITHVDPATGEQHPLSVNDASQVVGFPNGDFAVGGFSDLYRVTRTTGAHRLPGGPDVFFRPPFDLEADAAGNLYFTRDDAVSRVEAATGLLEVITSGGDLIEPTGLAVDVNGDVFIADPGARTVFLYTDSQGRTPFATGGMLNEPRRVALLPNGDLLVSDGRELIRVARGNQAQSLFATTPDRTAIGDLFVDSEGDVFTLLGGGVNAPPGRGYCVDEAIGLDTINRVEQNVGVVDTLLCSDEDRKILWNFLSLDGTDTGLFFVANTPMSTQENGSAGPAVLDMDQATGATEVVSAVAPIGSIGFAEDGRLFAIQPPGGGTSAEVRQVDPRTGASVVVASSGLLGLPTDVVVSADQSRLFVLDSTKIIRINPQTGSQAEWASGDPLGGFAEDRLRLDTKGDLIAVSSGKLIFVDAQTPNTMVQREFQGVVSVLDAADAGGGTTYVLDSFTNDILEVDGGQNPVGGEDFFTAFTPVAMLLDSDGSLLVSQRDLIPNMSDERQLERVDPSDASRTTVSEFSLCSGGDMEFAVVPEPSATLSVGVALALLLTLLRHRIDRRGRGRSACDTQVGF